MNIQRAYVEITNLCNLHCDFCAGHHRPLMAMRTDDFAVAAKKLRTWREKISTARLPCVKAIAPPKKCVATPLT